MPNERKQNTYNVLVMFPFVGNHLYMCCVCLQYEYLKGKSTLNVAGFLALELDSGICGAQKKFKAEHFDP